MRPPRTLAFGALGSIGSMVFMAAVLGLSAGRWELPMPWAYVVVFGSLIFAGNLFVDPELRRERWKPGPGGRDELLVHAAKVAFTAQLLLAGLDIGRWHYSDTVPLWGQLAGLAGFTVFIGLAFHAMSVNRFFSPVIRLQTDRGHHLITAGPYRFIRHPGYAGIIAAVPCGSLALGSVVPLAPALLFVVLVVRRCLLEDRFLHERLEGYPDYARRVRYRLLPLVW